MYRKVYKVSILTSGTGYNTGNFSTTGGSGSGLTIKVFEVDDEGKVLSIEVENGGSYYNFGDVVTLSGGNGCTVKVDDLTNFTLLGYVKDFINVTPGTGYTISQNVETTGGSGIGLTIDIISVDNGSINNVKINDSGYGYTLDDVITINGGDFNSTFKVKKVSKYCEIITQKNGKLFKGFLSSKKIEKIKGIENFKSNFPFIQVKHNELPDKLKYYKISGNSIVFDLDNSKDSKKEEVNLLLGSEIERVEKLYKETETKNKTTFLFEQRLEYLRNNTLGTTIDSATNLSEIEEIEIEPWTYPVIDNLEEDKSKLQKIFYASSEPVSSTTSSNTYIQKLRLELTVKPGCYYFIWYYSETYTSNNRRQISTRVQINDTDTIQEINIIPANRGSDAWGSFSGEYVTSFNEESQFIDIDFKANGSSVSMRRARIVVTEIVLG